MRTDILQITDMVNTKLAGMFELINHWGPANTTIKSTLLKDIQHIQHELTTLNTKERKKNSGNMKPKCRNGDSCWYLKQGRCWFAHDPNGNNCNTTADRQQSRANISTPNRNNNNSNNSKRSNKLPNAKRNKKAKKKKQNKKKSSISDGSDNMNRKKKKPSRRRRKKKKQTIGLQSNAQEGNDIAQVSSSGGISPIVESTPQANASDIGNFKHSQTLNDGINQPLVPCVYKFDTIDRIESVIDEQDLLNQMDFFTDTNEKLFALLQIRNLCDCAVESEWTLQETMTEVDEMINNFKIFKMT